MITIDGYVIDAALSERHTRQVEATDDPVEKGADITKHARQKPELYDVEGIVSNTPIGEMARIRGFTEGGFILPSEEAKALLKKILADRNLVTIETEEDETLENMLMLSFDETRDSPKMGDCLRFTATFKQLTIVTSERTTVPTAVPRGQKKRKRGPKPSPPAPEAPAMTPVAVDGSTAHGLVNGDTYLTRHLPAATGTP